jgi:transcription elongation factor Elf1
MSLFVSVEDDRTAKCPRCGSPSVTIVKRGYKPAPACCGYIVCGPLGFLCGQHGANKLEKVCMNCDHKWK